MPQRVVVFLDWQNVYRRGRATFGTGAEPHTFGQVDPLALARYLCDAKPDRTLTGIRIYRGIPTPEADPKGYAANRRQTAAWMRRDAPRTHVHLRSLQYLPGMDPREKGIDVQLAIDFVLMAVRHEFEVGVLFSVDSDLKPAIDAVCQLGEPAIPEVAAWAGPYQPRKRIAPPKGNSVWCHWLDRRCFDAVADTTNYGIP